MSECWIYDTTIGKLGVVTLNNYLQKIVFINDDESYINCNGSYDMSETDFIKKCMDSINNYLIGKSKTIDIPYDIKGSNFQLSVWYALKSIAYGTTVSYKDICSKIGIPKGYRAVGMACNKNPLPIIIPCHRVIGSNNSLTGYAGGLETKSKLLSMEQMYA